MYEEFFKKLKNIDTINEDKDFVIRNRTEDGVLILPSSWYNPEDDIYDEEYGYLLDEKILQNS